jgi:hypothetical protein
MTSAVTLKNVSYEITSSVENNCYIESSGKLCEIYIDSEESRRELHF